MKLKETSCDCQECKDMCSNRPCWPMVKEAEKMLDAGWGKKMMLDYWVRYPEDVFLLCGAVENHEKKRAPYNPAKQCVLQDKKTKKCKVYDIRPLEARIASHDSDSSKTQEVREFVIVKDWDTDEGRALVARWKAEVSFE